MAGGCGGRSTAQLPAEAAGRCGATGRRVRGESGHPGQGWELPRLAEAAGVEGLSCGRYSNKPRLGQEQAGCRYQPAAQACLSPGCGGAGSRLTPPPLGARCSPGAGPAGRDNRLPSAPSPWSLASTEHRPAVPGARVRRGPGLRLLLVRPCRCFQGDLGWRLHRGAAPEPGGNAAAG